MTDPWVSQTRGRSVLMVGILVSGGTCTVQFQEQADHWLMWPYGIDKVAVRLAKDVVRRAAQQLLGGQS